MPLKNYHLFLMAAPLKTPSLARIFTPMPFFIEAATPNEAVRFARIEGQRKGFYTTYIRALRVVPPVTHDRM